MAFRRRAMGMWPPVILAGGVVIMAAVMMVAVRVAMATAVRMPAPTAQLAPRGEQLTVECIDCVVQRILSRESIRVWQKTPKKTQVHRAPAPKLDEILRPVSVAHKTKSKISGRG